MDFYTFKGRLLPAWVALNRLAHADRAELVKLVGGAGPGPQVLLPVELDLLSHSKAQHLDAEQVLAAAVSALDAHAG